MISSSSASDGYGNQVVAGNYDVLLDDENPALIRRTLNRFLEQFARLELELSQLAQQNCEQFQVGQHQQHAQQQQNQQQQDQRDKRLGGYEMAFKQLRILSGTLKLDTDNLREGKLACNSGKNRYQDIIPFDHTRVKLKADPSVPGSDYINANFVSGSSGSPRAYIACQGPLKRTLGDFWRMVWECNVSVLVMACGEHECEPYWPEAPNTSHLFAGNIEVTLVKVRRICDDFLIRKFSVKLLQIVNNNKQVETSKSTQSQTSTFASTSSSASSSASDDGDRVTRSDGTDSEHSYHQRITETPINGGGGGGGRTNVGLGAATVLAERTICQFHYTTWPDHGVPQSVQPLLELLYLVRDVQPAEDKPILVHCSAGCGRTGTICCIDYVWGLMRRCKLEANSFDLHEIISEMRRQRMSMVQTLEQYILCHRAVAALFAEQLSIMQDNSNTADSSNLYDNTRNETFGGANVSQNEESFVEVNNFVEDDENCGPVFI